MSESDYTVVSAEDANGRVLSGVGVDVERLEQTVERHAPNEPVASPAEPAKEPTQPEKEPRGRVRFSKLTSELEETKKAREAAERERDEFKQKWESAQKAPVAEPVRSTGTPLPTRAPVEAREKPKEDEVGTKYQTYADFIEDLADWKAEQRLAKENFDAKIRASIDADHSSRAFRETVSTIQERGRKAYPDFDAVLKSGPGTNVNFGSTPEQWTARAQYIVQHPHSEHLQYAIAKDGALAQKLAAMSDFEWGSAISALAPSSAVASPASTAPRESSTPPPPFQPVGSGSKTTALPLDDLPKKGGYDFDKSGYRERRAEQRGRLRRR